MKYPTYNLEINHALSHLQRIVHFKEMHHLKHNLVINQCHWHSRLKKIVRKSHPNIFEIIDVMRKEQATTEVDLVGVDLVGDWPEDTYETELGEKLFTHMDGHMTNPTHQSQVCDFACSV